jgi:phosphatidylglycerol:prolipoprotein diacylglycerol transferase
MLPTLFHLGAVPVTTWPILAFLGFWSGYFSFRHECRDLPIPARHVWYFYVGAATAGFAGSHWMFGINVGLSWGLGRSLAIWSGLSYYGGLVLATAYGAAVWAALGWGRKFSLGVLWDRMAPATSWPVILGRIGCTLYGCCYGSPSGTHWGYILNYDRWDFERRPFPEALRGVPLHPAPLYEALGLLVILWILARMRKREERSPGSFPPGARAAAFYVIYGIMRFFIEYIRMDERGGTTLGLYPSQWAPVLTIPLAILAVLWAYRRLSVTAR